jgi:predicted Zn-dependent protease
MTLRLAGVLAITLVTVNQEIDIGRQANQEVRSKLRELKDPEVTAWLRDVGQRLVRTAPGEKYPYSFSVPPPAAVLGIRPLSSSRVVWRST